MLLEVVSIMYDYEDYNTILDNTEELYSDELEQLSPDANDEGYWDNYYHNIAKELVDE